MNTFLKYFVISLSFFCLSCLQQRQPRLSQSLEGTIVSLSDVFNLKCVLKTGESLNKKMNWTEAEDVILEEKTKDGTYKKKSSVVYDGFDSKSGKSKKGYINDFSYVSIKSIEDSRSSFLASTEGESEAKIIQKGKLRCANLLTPEQHPFIIAKSHHSYNLEFQVIGDYLRALIVASPEDIPFQSLSYSIKMKDNLYGMPIGGYKVGLGYLEEVLNSDFEATRILTFREVPIKNKEGQKEKLVNSIPTIYPQGVREIQVRGEFQPFRTLSESGDKKDVFPKSLFAGDWHYNSTIVRTSVSHSGWALDSLHTVDNEYRSSNKIKIVFKDKHLIAYNLNIERDLPALSSLNKKRFVFKIPVQHLSYESSPSLSGQIVNAGLNEILNKREDDADKDFVRVNFGKIETFISKSLNQSLDQPAFSLSELHFSKDYMSFVLHDEQQGSQIRHSFLRPKKNSTYTPLNVSRRNHNLFPAFYLQKRIHDKDLALISKDYQESYLIKRFNINEPIVYRFSKLTPKLKYVRDLGRETIHLWNQVFKKAGVTCAQKDCFILDESQDVALGDIRYNVLNLLDPRDLLGRFRFLGFGPSVADFETGEVVSSSTNVVLNAEYNSLAKTVNEYIMDAHGLDPSYRMALWLRRGRGGSYHQDSSHFGSSNLDFLKRQLFSGQLRQWFIPSGFIDSQKNLNSNLVPVYGLDIDTTGHQEVKYITSIDELVTTKEDQNRLANLYQMATGKEPSTSLSNDQIFQEITQSKHEGVHSDHHNPFYETLLSTLNSEQSGIAQFQLIKVLCKKELKDIVASADETLSPHQTLEYLWSELSAESLENKISLCIEKLMPIVSLNIVLHEMGHNISFYHNFAGSSDKDNFLKLKDFKFNYVFSDLEEGEKEELLKLNVVQPSTSTVMDYLGSQAVNLIPGQYDVDFVRFIYKGEVEDVINKKMVSVDPVELTDLSTGDPLNIDLIRTYRVCSDLNFYYGSMDPFCQVFDVGTTALEILENHYRLSSRYHTIQYFINKSIPFYHKWRLELSKILEGSDPYYLSSFKDSNAYSEIIKNICLDESHKLSDLCKASRFFAHKIKETLFEPDHYCMVEYPYTEQLDVIPFDDLHREIKEREDYISDRSSCKDLKDFLFFSAYKLIGEIGKPFFNMSFSTDKNYKSLHTRFDRAGNVENKLNSVLALLASTTDSVSFLDGGLQPISVMDEPDIREAIHESLKNRITKGFRMVNGKYAYVFSNEELLLNFATQLFAKHVNATNSIVGIQNYIKNFVRLTPFGRREDPLRVKVDYLKLYKHVLGEGGLIIDEPLEYKMNDTEPFVIIPFSNQGFIDDFIEGIKIIRLKRDMIKLWNINNQLNEKENTELSKTTPEKLKDFQNHIQEILSSVIKLSQWNEGFSNATIALLYDYFERGQDTDLVTDNIIPYLQLSKLLKVILPKLELEEVIEETIGNNTSETSKNYLDIISTTNDGPPSKKNIKEPNPVKPYVVYLLDYFENNEKKLLEVSNDILDLYLLDLFRSSKYENSQSHLSLKALSDKVMQVLEKKDKGLPLKQSIGLTNKKAVAESQEEAVADTTDEGEAESQEEAVADTTDEGEAESQEEAVADTTDEGEAVSQADTIKIDKKQVLYRFNSIEENISKLKELRHFFHSAFLREILVRDLFISYSGRKEAQDNGVNVDSLSLGVHIENTLTYLAFLDLFTEQIKASPSFIDKDFHNQVRNLMEYSDNVFIQEYNAPHHFEKFQRSIPSVLTTSYVNKLKSIFEGNSFMYFLTHDNLYKGQPFFRRFLDNRLQKEMKSQENILFHTIRPFFDIYDN